jgi:hypothetical protein
MEVAEQKDQQNMRKSRNVRGHLSLSVSMHAHSTLSSPTQQAGDHTRPVVEFHIMSALPDGRRAVVLREL